MTYFWTIIPFLIFFVFILRHEIKYKKRETIQKIETERFMSPIATVTGRMFEKRYGRPSSQMENAFPDIKNAK